MNALKNIATKILTWETASSQAQSWKQSYQKIVFTNGCFDLMHYGHLHYLAAARKLGDKLLVGLNADSSVKRLKGEHRPINDEQTRLFMLASLEFVDGVALFDEDTPLKLIQLLQPDVLVKGGDWAIHQIVGADIVLKNGGMVRSLPFVEGYSTTNLEQKILGRYEV